MALFFILDKILQESWGWIIFVICIIGWKRLCKIVRILGVDLQLDR